ncbi:uncharacterized protein YjcR [Nocardioides ginsengisegetis]|uniref:Uncharacterized protein YjcR n=1 Tax=Nocardioides ginsengisegetis TaxID=661491 RepID=A0A7W3J4B7_9ACTN|nr:hypothetical protein [Nocardioides ginsengisegetis]MBA8805987.1 uncharacterized protein YjcR [Nocardioides ginsengisegetis]
MTPQHKGVVPPDHAARLIALRDQADTAAAAFKDAVADALKAGGSVREVAKVTGLSTRTVREWGTARGWPTQEQKTVNTERRRRNAEWRDGIEAGMKELGGDG